MSPIDPDLRISSVSLAVADLQRSADFYERVLGLPLLARDDLQARLGADPDVPALTLSQLPASTPIPYGSTGLFHVAWLHPSRAALAETVRRIAAARWPIEGASDHGVSEALYLSDPDGLGIEIYADRPREEWQRPPDGRGVNMVTLPLDVEDLLAQSPQAPGERVAPGTSVGHIHLKVSDLPTSASFYAERLGFEEQARIPSAAFLSAGGYHHHVGLNSWQSSGGTPPPETAPRLLEVGFELSDADQLARLADGLGDQADGEETLSVRDPDGQLLSFTHR